MSPWTSPNLCPPEVELLQRRWGLPVDRIAEVRALLQAHKEGATALELPAQPELNGEAFGDACFDVSAGCAAADAGRRPLVLTSVVGRRYLQSWRYHEAEKTIALEMVARAADGEVGASRSSTGASIEALGPGELNVAQAQAVACALTRPLAIISGGPGTGKTHTIARLLALQLCRGMDPASIQLAAPTGRAAERMKEAVELASERLPASITQEVRRALKRIAGKASTLHRLLGANPTTGRCAYNRRRPLPCALLIVDECSMVDTLVWQSLLEALKRGSRLVLVGDPNQLESVRAGDVFGSFVRFARRVGWHGKIWTELKESQRFKKRPGIGLLAEALVGQKPAEAVALLRAHVPPGGPEARADEDFDGLAYLGGAAGDFRVEQLPGGIREALETVAFAADPPAALAALERIRFLTAHRQHRFGASGVNAAVNEYLAQRQPGSETRTVNTLAAHGALWAASFHIPIIINHNDPYTRLSNGSVGIVMTVAGVRRAYFPAPAAGQPARSFSMGQLPDHTAAWALTIHRSQGSEFDSVMVLLPREDSPLATRELLYTAITRARQAVYVMGPEATITAALSSQALRCTLLEAALEQAAMDRQAAVIPVGPQSA